MLTTLEFTHNNRRHAGRQNTPFELMLGTTPVAIPLSFENTKYPTIKERMQNLIKQWEEALAAHELARNRMAARRQDTLVPFKKGQKVWLDSWNLKTSYHKKIRPKWEGPFEIEEVLGPVTYQLKLPTSVRGHYVGIYIHLLTPSRPLTSNGIWTVTSSLYECSLVLYPCVSG